MTDTTLLPPALQDFILITEFDQSRLVVDALFRRKFGHAAPEMPRHLTAWYRAPDGALHLLSYSHMLPVGDIYLSGGACTDGDVVRAMLPEQRAALTQYGGARRWVLSYALIKYAHDCDAFFAYCGNPRALSICTDLGFEATAHPYLIARWHKPLHPNIQRCLLAKAHALGPF